MNAHEARKISGENCEFYHKCLNIIRERAEKGFTYVSVIIQKNDIPYEKFLTHRLLMEDGYRVAFAKNVYKGMPYDVLNISW